MWLFVAALCCIIKLNAQIAPPVAPCYNLSEVRTFFASIPSKESESVADMKIRGAVEQYSMACLTKTNANSGTNRAIYNFSNETIIMQDPSFLPGTTYWINNFFHMGHVFYDIGLLQVLQSNVIDRIILQRGICHGNLCSGVGSMDSFYKSYFTTIFEAFGQPNIPLYLRWTHYKKEVTPFYFSSKFSDLYNKELMADPTKNQPIILHQKTYFEKLIRRSDTKYGAIATVGASAVQAFKKTAYRILQSRLNASSSSSPQAASTIPQQKSALSTYFTPDPPFRILFSHRGPKASRHIENMDLLVSSLQGNFTEPQYIIRVLNNSELMLNDITQIQAVAEAHVVITNHGAFESNMIYMRNSSLFIELFGHYGNNEIHTFHRLALMFGLYYARVHSHALTDHHAPSYNLSRRDVDEIVSIVKEYFVRKPYLLNLQ